MLDARLVGKSLPQIWSGLPKHFYSHHVFDDLPLIDAFNRANQDPLSGSGIWDTRPGLAAAQSMEISSNQVTQLDSTTGTARSWLAQAFGPNQAACITVPTLPVDADDNVEIWLRLSSLGTGSENGYRANLLPAAASGNFQIDTVGGGASIVSVTRSFSAGDKFGIMAVGRHISIWHGSGGAWTCVGSVYDELLWRGGRIGIGQRDTEARMDDFRAGDLDLL